MLDLQGNQRRILLLELTVFAAFGGACSHHTASRGVDHLGFAFRKPQPRFGLHHCQELVGLDVAFVFVPFRVCQLAFIRSLR
jgi:hypothetical protein